MNPLLQRWVSADPLEVHDASSGEPNVYAYVSGRALQAVDPLGLESFSDGIATITDTSAGVESVNENGDRLVIFEPAFEGIKPSQFRAEAEAAQQSPIQHATSQERLDAVLDGASEFAGGSELIAAAGSGEALVEGVLSSAGAGQLPYGAIGELAANAAVGLSDWTASQKAAFGLGQALGGLWLIGQGLGEIGLGGGLALHTGGVTAVLAAHGATVAANGAAAVVAGTAMMMNSGGGAAGGGGKADFIVTPGGTAVPTSQSRMRQGFDRAGFPGRPTSSPGVEHTLPNGQRVRTMEPSGQAPRRASFENSNGQPVTPDGTVPQPPRGMTSAQRRQYVRDRTHIEQVP